MKEALPILRSWEKHTQVLFKCEQKEPAVDAKVALNDLSKRFLTIPGLRYKIMSRMMNLTPLGLPAKIDQMMMIRAIPKSRL